MGVMEGRDPEHIRARFKDIYQPALLANWKIWPAAQVRCLARFVLRLWALSNRDTIVHQFSFHASAVSCPIPTNVWRFLDPLPISSHLCVCLYLCIVLAASSDIHTEKAKNKTQRTLLKPDWITTFNAATSYIPIVPTFKYILGPSYPLYHVALAPPSPHTPIFVLAGESQTSSLAVLQYATF